MPGSSTQHGSVQLSPDTAAAQLLTPSTEARATLAASGIAASRFGRTIRTAVLTHPDFRAGRSRIATSQARRDGAQTAFSPQVSLGLDAVSAESSASTMVAPVLILSQLVYDGGAAHRGEEAAQERVAQTTADFAATISAVALGAVQAKVDVWRTRQLRARATENLQAIEGYIDQINDRLQAGAGTEAERVFGESRRALARARLIEATQAQDRAEAEFVELLGVDSPRTLRLPPVAPPTNGQGSPQLVSLDFAINAGLLELERERASYRPSVSVVLTARPSSDRGNLAADLRAQLGVNIALSDGGQRKAAVREAEAIVGTLQAQRASLSRQIARALAVARSDQRAIHQRVEAANLSIEASTAALAATQDQFAIGRREINALLDAQRDLVTAQESSVNAQADRVLQGYAILGMTGEILDLFGISTFGEAAALDRTENE